MTNSSLYAKKKRWYSALTQRFKNITTAVSYAALLAVSTLFDRSLSGQVSYQLTESTDKQPTFERPLVSFRLFSGGPEVAAKFRPASVNLLVNADCSLAWMDIVQLTRRVYLETENVIAKGKGGRGMIR